MDSIKAPQCNNFFEMIAALIVKDINVTLRKVLEITTIDSPLTQSSLEKEIAKLLGKHIIIVSDSHVI